MNPPMMTVALPCPGPALAELTWLNFVVLLCVHSHVKLNNGTRKTCPTDYRCNPTLGHLHSHSKRSKHFTPMEDANQRKSSSKNYMLIEEDLCARKKTWSFNGSKSLSESEPLQIRHRQFGNWKTWCSDLAALRFF